ncbi:MAG: enoyl-CoA hydratase/isomerase family protein [Sterolibacterium sp.]|nr:enoyl-CoA hydratase/isomerase family protein [Sterolibacterium sp.]
MNQIFQLTVDADGIATLLIDKKDSTMNTIDQVFIDEITESIDLIQKDEKIKGVILTSGKEAFLAGADLKGIEERSENAPNVPNKTMFEQIWSLSSQFRRMETCGKPIVCAINGTAVGGGTEIALACHGRVVADDDSIKLGLPEVQIGLLPAGGGTQRLPRLIGVQAALPLLLQGKSLTPKKALSEGFIDKVVPAADLMKEAKQWLLDNPKGVQPWDKKGYKVPGGAGAMSETVAQTLVITNAMLQAGTFHNMPAPQAIASAVYEGTQLPIDTALKLEAKYMVGLMKGSVSRGMIRTLFINMGKANKLMHRPEGVAKTEFKKIGVIGAGLMGAGVAYVCAKEGVDVVLIDLKQEAADKGKDYTAKKYKKAIERGRATQAEADATLARITATTDYSALKDAQLVVEAVFEDRGIKAKVIEALEAVLPQDAVIASNTSALPINDLAENCQRPENFIGMHFFSPVERMPLVEVICGAKGNAVALAKALDLCQLMSKTPIVVNDGPGFFTTRFIGAYITETMAMLMQGVSPALLENAAKSVGLPIGPLSVSDEIGLDVAHHSAQQQAKDLGSRFKPNAASEVVDILVEKHGRHGRKNGKGFFEYAEDGSKKLWSGLNEIWPQKPADQQPTAREVQLRMIYPQLVDAVKCVEEGVLTSPIDGDLGGILGVGFPPYTGGPFSMMDAVGIAELVKELDRLEAAYGEQFKAPQLLRDMARNDQTFYGSKAIDLSKLNK